MLGQDRSDFCLAATLMNVDARTVFPDPMQLLTSGGSATAMPSVNASSGKSPVANGYLWAAAHLADLMAKNQAPPDTVIYPAIFNLRHGLELVLKELIEGFNIELRADGDAWGHSLGRLWRTLSPWLTSHVADRRYSLGDFPSQRFLEVMVLMPEVVAVLDELDPNGEDARYDRTGKPPRLTLSRYPKVNLHVLRELAKGLALWAEEVMGDRGEVVAFIEARRRDRRVEAAVMRTLNDETSKPGARCAVAFHSWARLRCAPPAPGTGSVYETPDIGTVLAFRFDHALSDAEKATVEAAWPECRPTWLVKS
jgi:hypothetical protein